MRSPPPCASSLRGATSSTLTSALIEAINEDLARANHDEEAAAHALYDAIEARLAEARARLSAPKE